ncbi:protoheme IX farnesyltransferase, mitochondrial [Pseudomyrmex gracilis]|uniref:protoheme IX farnesyltransferase, mitochondrial n=1 Tax=Pseudomyrmex gracilis TaxID=219809 RepID=UPI00099549FB|nr:protoheme IX farnesyltransferase, mitochondrial [Pseudomyrmex gracilis]XP_020291282.1 protoheme IX farnesyltransferase, mitochondrial [Pseudomyrmex gracilis]
MLFIVHPLRISRRISCNFVPKLSIVKYSSCPKQKTTRICAEEVAQTVEDSKVRVASVIPLTSVIPLHTKESVTHKVKKDPEKVKESEWTPMVTDHGTLLKQYLKLSKIKLTSLVVATTMAGYALAPAPFDIYTFAMCFLGTGLVSGTANTINQIFEVPFDAQMKRTKNRTLVCGRLTTVHAAVFATISGVVGLSLLYHQVNSVTAILGAVNVVLYTLVYTPMKRISIANTWIGSVVGAIPPLMGWAACTGDVMTPGAWILPGILYAWQFPHFNALSWNLRPDYSQAGYRMMAVTDPGLCRRTTVRYTAALTGLCYLAPVLDVTSWWFALTSTPLNVYFLYLAWRFNQHSDSANSRKLFRFSLLHLPLLMILILTNNKYWSNTKKQDDEVKSRNELVKENKLLTVLTSVTPATSSV